MGSSWNAADAATGEQAWCGRSSVLSLAALSPCWAAEELWRSLGKSMRRDS